MATVAIMEKNDVSTIHGANLALIKEKTVHDPLQMSRKQLKEVLNFRIDIPDDQEWIANDLQDLLEQRFHIEYTGGEEEGGTLMEINESIQALCIV